MSTIASPRQPHPWPINPTEPERSLTPSLPRPLTSFVGREAEIQSITELLRSSARLVTVTGPGGAGKTRLAIEAAAALRSAFAGCHFVTLAAIRDSELVVPTIARALGVREMGENPLLHRLVDHIGGGSLLLLLDNFEQVAAAAPAITQLLERCPGLKAIVTSRNLLHVSGEHQLRIRPLPLPDPRPNCPAGELVRAPAVALFVDRARAADPTFELADGNASTVIAICTRVDCLPLAIELAAAHIRFLSPTAILVHLERRLDLLTDGPRDQPARLQSMRDTIAWSYDLLPPDLQSLFLAACVFTGGFTSDAIASVADTAAGPGEAGTLARGALVDASLLVPEPGPSGEPRYFVLETIREFGLDRLAARPDLENLHARHAAYFLALAESAEAPLIASGASRWVARLATERANLRTAVEWSLAHRGAIAVLRLAGTLLSLSYARGEPAEALAWLEAALAQASVAPPDARADGYFVASALAQVQGEFARSRALCTQSLGAADAHGYALGRVRALTGLGITAEWMGDLEAAATHYAAASTAATDVADRRLHHWTVLPIANLADVALLRGDHVAAMALGEQAVNLWRGEGYVWGIAQALGTVAAAARERGEIGRAGQLYAEALDHWLGCFDGRGIAGTIAGIAGLAASLDRVEHAARLLGAAWAIADALGVRFMAHHLSAERIRAQVRERLSPARFDERWKSAKALGLDAAVAEARLVLRWSEASPRAAHGLTPREIDVLRLISAGRSDREIATALAISPRTVQSHVSSLFTKLGASTRAEAAALGVRKGIA